MYVTEPVFCLLEFKASACHAWTIIRAEKACSITYSMGLQTEFVRDVFTWTTPKQAQKIPGISDVL